MKKIFVALLMFVLSICMVSCSSSKANKEDKKLSEEDRTSEESTDSSSENKAKESKEESSEDKESESEESSLDTENSTDISTAIYVTRISEWDNNIVRKILTYEYRNNKILKLTEFSSIRYKPVGEKIEESDREEAKEVFGKNAAIINDIDGIDVVTDVGDEEYSQVVTYDYTKLGFEEYNKVCKILGWDIAAREDGYDVMSKVAANLIYQGYIEVKKDDFKGSKRRAYELSHDGSSLTYIMEYKDDAINKFSFHITANYEVLGLASKEEAQAKYYLKEQDAVKGADYNFEFRDDGIVIDAAFDLVNGSCEEFRKRDSNFIFKSADEFYMSYIVPNLISQGFREKEVEGYEWVIDEDSRKAEITNNNIFSLKGKEKITGLKIVFVCKYGSKNVKQDRNLPDIDIVIDEELK